ncbi:MAG: DUF6134 family protein [Pseudomonadota bacterium]|nr:DUF6134 family protein [Pseudomonadota bacterium]
MNRRKLLIGTSATVFAGMYPSISLAQKASTSFSLVWRGLEVGYSKINLTQSGNKVTANIDVEISVKILSFDAFSYKLKNKETWESGTLTKLASETLVGKKKEFAKGNRTSKGFKVEGSKFSGIVKGNPATTSYFSPDFLKRKTWISTQDGDPLEISTTKVGADMAKSLKGNIPATLWKVTGDLELELLYSEEGKWLGSRFYAGGSQAEFVLNKSNGNMHSLWKT